MEMIFLYIKLYVKYDVQSTSWMVASCCVNPDRYTTYTNAHLLFLS